MVSYEGSLLVTILVVKRLLLCLGLDGIAMTDSVT